MCKFCTCSINIHEAMIINMTLFDTDKFFFYFKFLWGTKNVPFYLVILIKGSCSCRRNEKQDISSCSTCTGIGQIDLKDLGFLHSAVEQLRKWTCWKNALELMLLVFPGRITKAWIKNYTTETQVKTPCSFWKGQVWIWPGEEEFEQVLSLLSSVLWGNWLFRWELNLLILFWN